MIKKQMRAQAGLAASLFFAVGPPQDPQTTQPQRPSSMNDHSRSFLFSSREKLFRPLGYSLLYELSAMAGSGWDYVR